MIYESMQSKVFLVCSSIDNSKYLDLSYFDFYESNKIKFVIVPFSRVFQFLKENLVNHKLQ